MNKEIGERLAEERKRLGYNQTVFAEVGGVKRAAQVNYEGGRRNPDTDYLSRLAAIGLDITYVLTGIKAPENNAKPLTEKNALASESQEKIRAYIHGQLAAEAEISASVRDIEDGVAEELRWLEYFWAMRPQVRKMLEPILRAAAAEGIKAKKDGAA